MTYDPFICLSEAYCIKHDNQMEALLSMLRVYIDTLYQMSLVYMDTLYQMPLHVSNLLKEEHVSDGFT